MKAKSKTQAKKDIKKDTGFFLNEKDMEFFLLRSESFYE